MLTMKKINKQQIILKKQLDVIAKKIDKINYTALSAEIKVDRVLGMYHVALDICKQNNIGLDKTKKEILIQTIEDGKPANSWTAKKMEQ